MKFVTKIERQIKKNTGVAVPLGAIRSEKSPFIGEYTALGEFAEFCKKSGLSVIQLLPVLDSGTESSPYSSLSAFALHPIYIDLKGIPIFEKCYSMDSDFKKLYDELLSLSSSKRFDYARILELKDILLRKIFQTGAFSGIYNIKEIKTEFDSFIDDNADWIKSYCVFKNLKYKYMQAGWNSWADCDKNLTKEQILERWNDEELVYNHHFYVFEQLFAHKQLKAAAEKIRSLGIILKGDLPILLNEDSCDVWANPQLFNMKLRAGSPPDGDNPSGQNWGFPVYNWDFQKKDDFAWWKLRLSCAEQYFDAYRLDHIPGFFRFWATHFGEETAELGATMPHSTISEKSISDCGFSKERIRWLREPHLSTELFFRKTGNFDTAHKILSIFCERIGHEELWLFKRDFKSVSDIRKVSLEDFDLDEQIQKEITDLLCQWWKNRTLIELKRGEFVPYCKFGETLAWSTLNQMERDALLNLFEQNNKKQERKWKTQAEQIFQSLIPSTKMIPCGEDLGVSMSCMPKVLDEYGILGLKVVRWCRDWEKEKQPFEDFKKYRKLSLVTTSVHDSSTLRQWWNSEKSATKEFCQNIMERRKNKKSKDKLSDMNAEIWGRKFDAAVAEFVLSNCATTSGMWFVNPLQDWLYLDSEFYSENADDERINIPGTVSKFNWTWRMPCTVENLAKKSELSEKIKNIVKIHDL